MCTSTIQKLTDPGTFGIGNTKSEENRRKGQQQEQTAAAARSTKKTQAAKVSSTRSKQIEKFTANVATGGARRAASTGR